MILLPLVSLTQTQFLEGDVEVGKHVNGVSRTASPVFAPTFRFFAVRFSVWLGVSPSNPVPPELLDVREPINRQRVVKPCYSIRNCLSSHFCRWC
jgi:hypothetical protein